VGGQAWHVRAYGIHELFSMICVFLFLGVCRPFGAYWSVSVQGTCLSKREVMNITIAYGGTSSKPCEDRDFVDHADSAVNNYRSHQRCASRHLSPQLTD